MKEWISIEERLPEMDVEVLTFVAKQSAHDFPRKLGVRVLRRSEINSEDGWCDPLVIDCFFAVEKCVTHWMPLPFPPQD